MERPFDDPLADSRRTAAPRRRERRWAGRKPARPAAAAARRGSGGRTAKSGGRSGGARLRGMVKQAGIDKKISPHKLRHTYATNLLNAGAELVDIKLNAGAELVDIKALLGHESIATAQIHTDVGQEKMEKVVGRL